MKRQTKKEHAALKKRRRARREEKEAAAEAANAHSKATRPKERLREAWRRGEYRPELPPVGGRLAAIDRRRPRFPLTRRRLEGYAERILSQHGEDGITYELLKRTGMATRRCVELGSGSNGGNAGFMIAGLGYRGLLVDGDSDLAGIAEATFGGDGAAVACEWITRDGINQVIERHGFVGEIDYLGIDLDGVDWWIWDALEVVQPRIVIAEYNAILGPAPAVTVPYREDFSRKARDADDRWLWPKGYFGASLRAFERLARRKGYRLVASAPGCSNAYFVRDDLALGTRTRSVNRLYQPPRKANYILYARQINETGVRAWEEEHGALFVEISEDGRPLELGSVDGQNTS